jgi:cysteinyl-tRNA synthetase
MGIVVYNTLARRKEPFQTIQPGKVRMYVCGPTVYDKAHVGHAMSSLVFDVIRRYLIFKGYQVIHVMNYTDVDDKVIQRANELGVDPVKLAEQYIQEYDQHLKDLNILPATVFPRVSQEIETIVDIVQGLEEKGFTYDVEGDVFFRVTTDEDYGKLSGRRLEDMRAGARLAIDARKEDPADFALWKAAKSGEPAWESPWGKGRPGWHIECSAMSFRHLGAQIDIHGGGNDLIFPHHENEIAQSESYTGKEFARFWVHNGMMQLRGEDMSKSVGNMVTIDEFLSEHEGDVLRMLVLNANYRAPVTFNREVVMHAERALERMRGALRPSMPAPDLDPEIARSLQEKAQQVRREFEAAMDDDFNTPAGLGQLFELVREINQARDAGVDGASLKSAQDTLVELAEVLGLRLRVTQDIEPDVEPFIDLLVEIRQELREAQQWELADQVRDRLADLDIILEDRKEDTIWHFRKE